METNVNVNTIENKMPNRPLPKQAYDSEYFTEWKREVDFLYAKGITCSFVRKNQYGVSQYKYTKTPELFAALTIYYSMIQAEKNCRIKPRPRVEEKPEEKEDKDDTE